MMNTNNSLELLSSVAVELTRKANSTSNDSQPVLMDSKTINTSKDLSLRPITKNDTALLESCFTHSAGHASSSAGLNLTKEENEEEKTAIRLHQPQNRQGDTILHLNEDPSTSSQTIHHSSAPQVANITTDTSPQTQPSTQNSAKVQEKNGQERKCVLFDTVTVYHFTRSQGFISIPSQGGSTLGMKRKHFLQRKLSVDLYEEVRRRSRREILLKIKLDKHKQETHQIHCNSASSSASNSSTSNATTSSSSSDSDDDSFSEYSDISDSELNNDSFVFCQPINVKLRRSLLRASGVGRIDPKEKRECRVIRESRDRSGCNCVNQCIPGLCECSILGVNCHVDRISFPCGCVAEGCRNPLGRTEFDIKGVKRHHFQTLFKSDEEIPSRRPRPPDNSIDEVGGTTVVQDAAPVTHP